MGTRTSDETDKALQESCLRVIVGMLMRANKQYVSQNPSGYKIFLKVIEELRAHFLVVRRANALRERMEQLKDTKSEIAGEAEPADSLCAKGLR
jgi:hypothetical protein